MLAVACSAATPAIAAAQTFSYRGFVDLRALVFPQDSPHDDTNFVGDMLARGEAFYRPTSWAQFAFGLDARANSDDQVDTSFQVDLRDRLALRPSVSVRRLSATFTNSAQAFTENGQIFHVVIEHRLMHAETMAYMWHWLDYGLKTPGHGQAIGKNGGNGRSQPRPA